jgi:hypothetical protein
MLFYCFLKKKMGGNAGKIDGSFELFLKLCKRLLEALNL